MDVLAHWEPDPDEWRAVTEAIKHERDLSGIPYPPEALAYSALQALAHRDRGAVDVIEAARTVVECWESSGDSVTGASGLAAALAEYDRLRGR